MWGTSTDVPFSHSSSEVIRHGYRNIDYSRFNGQSVPIFSSKQDSKCFQNIVRFL